MKTVLAYSGGLDTTVILRWLIEEKAAEVYCFVADLGQEEEVTEAREKAMKTGAKEVFVSDLKEEFVSDFVFPMFKGNALYENSYLLGTSIARPCIAKEQVEIAKKVGANVVAHGATGKGNDQVRFELGFAALNPKLEIIAPWREWDFKGRRDLLAYVNKRGLGKGFSEDKLYSMDRNVLHCSYEGGVLEDPWHEVPEDILILTKNPLDAPDKPEDITLEFREGEAVKLNGQSQSPFNLLKSLNSIAGKHGVGRVDLVESRFVGMKSRGFYETPGGSVLFKAHQDLESITLDREEIQLKNTLAPLYAKKIYEGFWFSPERLALQAAIDQTQKRVNGEVKLRLYKGQSWVLGRRSGNSLYNQELASFEGDTLYSQKDAEGFIRLQGLRLKVGHGISKS